MREVLEHMSIAQLIDTILINPTVHVAPSYRDTGLSATYTFQPLSNLVYTRDQQARAPRVALRPALGPARGLPGAAPLAQ
jgi:arginine deiminase